MKRSVEVGIGIYQFEFFDDHIGVAKWDEPPRSTSQWVNICPNDGELFKSKYNKFFLQGTCPEDVCVVPVEGEDVSLEEDCK